MFALIGLLADTGGEIWIALGTVVVASVVAPLVISRNTTKKLEVEAKLRREDIAADRALAREDEQIARALRKADLEDVRLATLAAKAEAKESADAARKEAAEQNARLLASQKEQQAALLESSQVIAGITQHNTEELAVVKQNSIIAVRLADGALTAAMESQLWALKGKHTSDKLLVAYKLGTSDTPTPEEYKAIAEQTQRIAVLEAELDARHEAMASVDRRLIHRPGGDATPQRRSTDQPAHEPQPTLAAGQLQTINIDTARINVAEAKPLEVHSTEKD